MNTPLSSTAALHPAGTLPLSAAPAVATGSGVSWGAILAGAAGAAALSLILLILGTGLGLSSVSPWVNRGVGATALGISTVAWLTFTQLSASGMGGYLAGRLRTKWASVQSDEVYFRDTAHGFLAWAVATLVTAAVLTSAIGSIVGTGAQAGATVAGGVVSAGATAATGAVAGAASRDDASSGGSTGYFVDALFRRDAAAAPAAPAAAASGATATASDSKSPQAMPSVSAMPGSSTAMQAPVPLAEVARIFATNLRADALPADDARYVGQLVAQRTGLPQAEAEKRVTDTFTRMKTRMQETETAAREAADTARKASAGAALWLFVSLLIGAFVASWAATFGGRQRDL